MSRKKNQPQLYEKAEVIDAGTKGKNIARAANLVILVDNAVPGDIVDIETFKKKRDFSEGHATHFHHYSERRVQPFCSHFDNCGGCSWQNMHYESQLHFKQKMVSDSFKRIAKLEIPEMDPILGSAKTEYYRNKLDYTFSNKKWLTDAEMKEAELGLYTPGLGFHIRGRFDKVLDISRCYLQADPGNQIRLAIREWAIEHDYPFFDLRQQSGSLRSLIIRTTGIGELMVILVFYKDTSERIEALMQFIANRFPDITSLYYVLNPKANDTTFDLEHHLYKGKSYITEQLNGIKYRVGPKSFFQTNPWQAELLFAKTMEMAALTGNEVVYDLYTGVGSIALLAAKNAKKVIGIESVEEAIEFAKTNAEDNNITNTEFFAGDVKDVFTDDFIAEKGRPDVIITDPPRTGMDKPVVEKILDLLPGRIVYVSCNPATQARDLELMKEHYTIERIQPVDMFPHTYHVENIALLIKK